MPLVEEDEKLKQNRKKEIMQANNNKQFLVEVIVVLGRKLRHY